MEIRVEKDKSVALKSLHQWRTYAGLLEGVPTSRLNERIIVEGLEKVKELCQVEHPYLIKPEPIPLGPEFQNRPERGVAARLPAYICIAKLRYYKPVKNEEMDYSILGVLWFQDEFALPIEEKILKEFENLPWSEAAQDCEY